MQLRHLLLPLGPLALVGCATGTSANNGGPDAQRASIDAPRGDVDAAAIDAPPRPDAAPQTGGVAPLLLTEVALQPNAGEFIEIGNPTGSAVDLSHYYLSDAGTYFRLPASNTQVGASDFVAHFPASATIPAHGVVVVALDTAANFHTQTGVQPNWSVADGSMIVVDGSAATLTNAGEIVVLFYWDGASDLVTDVDMLLAGVPASGNGLFDKSNVAIDGPDPGTTTSSYAHDTDTIPAQTGAPGSGKSTKRILLPAGHESAGGNGVGNTDQTSEDTRTTWDATFTAPTPGTTTLAL